MTGARRSATALLVVAGATLWAPPALAAERVVEIGRDGVQPQVLRVEPGDTLRFVNEDRTFAYRARSTGGPWRFDSGPTALLDGDFVVPGPLTAPGTYTYRVAQDTPFAGSVVVGDGDVQPAPTAGSGAGASPTTAAAAPAAPVPPAPVPPVPVPPAAVAPPAVPGPLAGPPSGRALGLAVAVAAVLLVGAASLLLRLLLAVPVLSDGAARLRAPGRDAPRW